MDNNICERIEKQLLEMENKREAVLQDLREMYPNIAKELASIYETEKVNKNFLFMRAISEVPDIAMEYKKTDGNFKDFLNRLTEECMKDVVYWKEHEEELRKAVEKYGDPFEDLNFMQKTAYTDENPDRIRTLVLHGAVERFVTSKRMNANA